MANKELMITLGLDSASFTQKIKKAKELNKDLDKSFQLLSSSTNNFENNLQGLGKKQDYLNKKIKLATAESAVYADRLKECQEALNKSRAESEKYTEEVTRLKRQQEAVGIALGKNSKQYEQISEKLKASTQLMDKANKTLALNDRRVTEASVGYKSAQISIQELGREATLTSEKMSAMKADKEMEKLSGAISEAQRKFDNVRNSVVGFDNTMEGLEKTQDHYNSQTKLMNNLLDNQKSELKSSKEVLSSYEAEVSKIAIQLREWEEAIEDLDASDSLYREMSQEIEGLRFEYSSLNRTIEFHKERVEKLENDYKQSENALAQYSNKLGQVSIKMQELNKKANFEPIKKSINSLTDGEIKKLENQLENLENEFQLMETTCKGYENTITGLNVKQKQFLKMISLAETAMQAYKTEIKTTSSEVERLTNEQNQLEKELIQQSKLLKTLSGADWDLKAKNIEELKQKYSDVNKKLEEHKSRLKDVEKSYQSSRSSVANLSSQLKDIGVEMDSINRKALFEGLERSSALASTKVELLDNKLELARSRVGNFDSTLKGVNKTISIQKEKIEALQGKLLTYENRIGANISVINKLESEQKGLIKTCESLRNKLKSMDSAGAEFDQTTMALASLENELEDNIREVNRFKDANDSLQSEIDQTTTQINELTRANKILKGNWAGDKFIKFGDRMQNIGGAISSVGSSLMGVTYTMAGLGGVAVKTGMDFTKSMSKVRALTGANDKEFEKLTNTARELGRTTTFTAKESADALGFLALAGYDVNQACEALPTILAGAQAGAMDLATASDKATDSISSLGYIGEEAVKMLPEYMNKVAQASADANTSMEQLMDAFIKCGGQMDNLNIPLDTSISMLGVLSNRGIKGAEAGNSLNSILINMTKKSGESAKAMDELGLSMFDAEGNIRPVEDVMKDLAKALSGLSEEKQVNLINMIGGKTQAKTLQKLLQGMVTDTGNLTQEYEELKQSISTAPEKNALMEMSEKMTDNLAGDVDRMKSALADLAQEFFEAFSPELRDIVQRVTDVISNLTQEIKNLTPEQKEMIIKIMGLIAVAPLAIRAIGFMAKSIGFLSKGIGFAIKFFTKFKDKVKDSDKELTKAGDTAKNSDGKFGTLGNALGKVSEKFSKLEGKIVSNGGKIGDLVSKFGLLGTVAIPLAIGALVGLMAHLGENEEAILKLQEKWGSFGTVIGAVCEFISGIVQLTLGGMANMVVLVCDVIASIIDGAGGQTIADSWRRYNARQDLILEEGMAKLALSTTRGMSQLRHLQDTELNLMMESMKITMDNIPLIIEGEYQQASQNMATSLSEMSSNQLIALTNLNDTTRVLFSGIREGMTIEEIVPILVGNFEQINNSGKFSMEDLKEGVSRAMETTRGQMDSKTSEGATAVEQNMNDATNAVNTATSEMASEASSGMANVAGAMIDESGKIPPEIQSNMEISANTIETTLSTMARNIEKSFNDLCYNAEHYLQRIINKAGQVGSAFSSCSSQVYSFASNAMRWVDTASSNIISDWNRVINTLNRSITGSVTINKTINESVVSKPQTFDLQSMRQQAIEGRVAYMQERTNELVAQARSYQPASIFASQAESFKNNNDELIDSLREQNEILMQMLTVLMSERETTINTSLVCSGREIAKASAKYMKKEIADIDKQTNRKRGII